ncbi:MAG: DUF748 domain-containing protein [Myxococcota bacterium]
MSISLYWRARWGCRHGRHGRYSVQGFGVPKKPLPKGDGKIDLSAVCKAINAMPFSIDRFTVHQGSLSYRDVESKKPFEIQLRDIYVELRNLANSTGSTVEKSTP